MVGPGRDSVAHDRRGLPPRASIVLLAAGVAGLAALVLLPGSNHTDLVHAIAAVACASAGVYGVHRTTGVRAPGWSVFVAGWVLIAVAEVWKVVDASSHEHRAPSTEPADLVYLAGYACATVGLFVVIQRRGVARDSAAWLDAATLGLAMFPAWLFVIEPMVRDPNATLAERSLAVAYPLLGVSMMTFAVRLAFGDRRVRAARVLLVGGIVAALAADTVFGLSETHPDWHLEATLDAAWLVSFVLVGAALLHAATWDPVRSPPSREAVADAHALAVIQSLGLGIPLVAFMVRLHRIFDPVSWLVLATTIGLLGLIGRVRTWRVLDRAIRTTAHEGEQRIAALVDNSQDLMALVDADGRITYMSRAAERAWGSPVDELIGRNVEELVPNDSHAIASLLRAARLSPPDVVLDWEGAILHPDGGERVVQASIVNRLDDASIGGIVITVRDVTDSVRLREQLRHQAFHDPLTGLPNRALFADRVAHALDRMAEHPTRRIAVLLIDLDDFKAVNDGLGHDHGDRLLRAVGERLVECMRPGDTVARLGGDEFAVLLEDVRGDDDAVSAATRTAEVLRLPFTVGDRALAVTASIGVAIGTADDTYAELLRAADLAMYRAKAGGKGRVETFRAELHAQAEEWLALRSDLTGALDRGELHVVYQPIVELASRHTVGMEALVRWDHPTRGAVSPDVFIRVAEESALISAIGAFVLRQGCRAAADWMHRTGETPYISVNVSAMQLVDDTIVDLVAQALRATGLPPGRLVLEITESMLVDDLEAERNLLPRLRDLGVRIAVDDFGTGYCSLAYLRRFNVDIVKIDKTFVSELGRESTERSLTKAMVALADTLGIATVAEGIERERQHHELLALGCPYGQGFYFAHPMDAARAADWIAPPVEQTA